MKLCPYFQKECLGDECIGAANLGGMRWICKPLGSIDISGFMKPKASKKAPAKEPAKETA